MTTKNKNMPDIIYAWEGWEETGWDSDSIEQEGLNAVRYVRLDVVGKLMTQAIDALEGLRGQGTATLKNEIIAIETIENIVAFLNTNKG